MDVLHLVGFQQLEYNTALCQGCNDIQNPLVIYFLFLPVCLNITHVCVCVTRLVCFTCQYAVCLFFFFFLWEEKKRAETLAKLWYACMCVLCCLQYLFASHFYMQYVFFL